MAAGVPEENFPFAQISPNTCRADASGNGGWCRFEVCTAGATALTAPGLRYYQARITPLNNQSLAETITTTTQGHATQIKDMRVNLWNGLSDAQAHAEFSYYMEAAWQTDTGQFIGPASEIEGGGGVTAPLPTAPVAPAPPVLLP
jgi:hypothetical protein